MIFLIPAILFFVYFFCLISLWIGLKNLSQCSQPELHHVSIIVAMKNEEINVRFCLDALVNQNYPSKLFEIIIVDDGSSDGTPLILNEYQQKYPFISVIKTGQTPSVSSSKKQALNKAIKKSSGQILIFTDADCVPPVNWVSKMVSCFEPQVGLAAGFSPEIDPINSTFGKILELDSLAAGIVAAGSIGRNKAVTCTGRNIAYRREVFAQINGFEEIMGSVSGDDDLFLQLVKNKTNWKIKYTTQIETIVPSFQTKSFAGFYRQKKRHLSAGKYYNFKIQIGYFLFHLANLGFFLCFLILLFSGKFFILSLSFLLFKFLADWFLLKSGSQKFNLTFTLPIFLLWEVFFLTYHLVIGPASWFGKIRW